MVSLPPPKPFTGVRGKQVWVAPKQWTYPLNIPLKFLGVPRVDGVLEEGFSPPWGAEIEHKVQKAARQCTSP